VADVDPELESIVAVSLRLERLPETFNVVGEDAGDRLVQHVAHALSLRVGEGGVLGRTRLDEFIAFQRIDRALATPERVMGALRNLPLSFTVDGLPIYLDHVSGSATFPDHTDNARDLLRKAEQAMIQARARRVDTALYDGQLDHNFRQRTRLFGELREALSRERLDIWFQPQFCLRTGKLSGAEALARWIRPDGSMVLPGEFIPLAEQSGLIKPLGELMLRRFFASAAQLRDEGLDLRCSVNLSARNLVDPQTLSVLAKLLAGSGVPADRVVVELTESSFADEPEVLMRTAFELRSMGIRQSIDDFGTGYSSLAYLRELPVDELKIDQVFLRQFDETGRSASLVRAMIGVAHTLGLEVVAEGVEDEAAERFLVRHGCAFGQGFLYAPAMPLDQFVDYARRTAPRELQVAQSE
jgi:EAL domain-containing protein (putative c-di-GMP-specific phosphodiesterase class I)/GGDEF domain-containing protein